MFNIFQYSEDKYKEFVEILSQRKSQQSSNVTEKVQEILAKVKQEGDGAIIELTEKYDGVVLKDLEVSNEELEESLSKIDEEFKSILEEAKKNIESYHNKMLQRSWCDFQEDGVFLGQKVVPLERVGVYVPGGTATYPSSVLMNIVPARVAGVKEIIMVTPPDKEGKINPAVAVAAKVAGIDKIYKVGGAQAIGALAYGTESIEKVDKIVGPGNIFVATAKKEVFGEVDIDMIAGPSEILVIADENANPKHVAADLLSQAEHDKLASSIFVTTSKKLMYETIEELKIQTSKLSRKEIIEESLENYGLFILCESIDQAIELSNKIAPEHLELMISNVTENLPKVKNAGSIFLGYYTPEPVGDYFAGPNHVLPTAGTAKFFSPLSTESFLKKSSFLYYSQEKLNKEGNKIIKFAEQEGLTAHANSVRVRVEDGRV